MKGFFKDLAAFYIFGYLCNLGWNLAILFSKKNRLKNFEKAKFSAIWKKKFRQ
jgi:hypothetical protein